MHGVDMIVVEQVLVVPDVVILKTECGSKKDKHRVKDGNMVLFLPFDHNVLSGCYLLCLVLNTLLINQF